MATASYRSVLKKVFFVDLDRCIGCKSCQAACSREHFGKPLVFVQTMEERAVPLHCQHCETDPCIKACPKEAIEKTDQGIVLINEIKCIGCSACVTACPFGILQLDEQRKVVVKCDLCKDKVEAGEFPTCVRTCPAEAAKFIPCIGCNICAVACPFAKRFGPLPKW